MPYSPPRQWPENTAYILKSMWRTHTTAEIVKAIGNGCSEAGLYIKARRLGLAGKLDHSKLWTPELDAELRRLWRSNSVSECAEQLGLTYNCVRSRAAQLGLPSRKRGIQPSRPFKPTRPLEFAPGHCAADPRSFELLQQVRACAAVTEEAAA